MSAKLLRVLLFALVVHGAQADDQPAVTNLDFRDGLAHWTAKPAGTGDTGFTLLDKSSPAGQAALHLVSTPAASKVGAESERFPLESGHAYRLSFQARNVVNRSNAGVFLRFFDAEGHELNNAAKGHDNADQDVAIINGLTGAGWSRYELVGYPPEGSVSGSIDLRAWAPVTADIAELQLAAFVPAIAPPWPPEYPLSAHDTAQLTEADVAGPDGRVYPDWRRAGVPGGISAVTTVVAADTFAGMEMHDISGKLAQDITTVAAAGGGSIDLPAGTFYLDHSLVIDQSKVVLRGAGVDKTHLIFRDRIPYGSLRFCNWAGAGHNETGPGGTIELQTNPKNLTALSLRSEGKTLAQNSIKMHWGNTYWLRVSGDDLLKKLGAGKHVLEGNADYADGKHVTGTFPVEVVPQPSDVPVLNYQAAIMFAGHGPQGDKVPLAADGKRGDRRLKLASTAGFRAGDRLRIEAPATPRWNALVGNHCPWGTFRAGMFEVASVDGDTLVLTQPLRIDFPVIDGTWVQRIATVDGVGIEGLTLEQEVVTLKPSGPKGVESHWYPIEDLWTDGVTFSYAWGCWARDLRVINAGRNPVYFPHSKFCEVRDSEFDNSLFKGVGGTAYIGFETAFDCLMDTVTTRDLRHAPDLQWGASGNVIRQSHFSGSDAQFHAGWTNENLLEGNTISADAADAENGGYGFGILGSGPSSPEHGPQGPRNVIYHNDVTSPSTGLVMLGGNENWMILHNRFHIDTGRAVIGKERTFDDIIADNVFVIAHPLSPAILFQSPECTGVELLDNRFSGPVGTIAGFRGGFGQFAREEGNQVLPASADAPLPSPAVDSIFLWERSHARTEVAR